MGNSWTFIAWVVLFTISTLNLICFWLPFLGLQMQGRTGGSGLALSEFKMFIPSLDKNSFSNSSNNFEISHFPWGMFLETCKRSPLGRFFIRTAIRIGPKCSAWTSKRCKCLETWGSPKRDFKMATASSLFPEVSSKLFNASFPFSLRRVLG